MTGRRSSPTRPTSVPRPERNVARGEQRTGTPREPPDATPADSDRARDVKICPASARHSRIAWRDDGLEDRLELEPRPADRLEHLARRGLQLEQLGAVARQPFQLGRERRLGL